MRTASLRTHPKGSIPGVVSIPYSRIDLLLSAPVQTVPNEKENTRFARNPLPG
ncbi:hypothetical protein AB434_1328 [Heyndrickxia coagulans]|uniref:Uncharacterized protein n=1 Tax=Heyndrickxia coagulans TaxID=1398 RepID=A0AAN0WE03_HEYCO|nr:hypothetical protein SB48_HM08orf06382 [Heyndrickxia coagulans]AKN53733.1 hypothetical protein AB434_1328 [Heyndrickxia coagulans]KYC60722.1 hypothetical protein B4100_1212 [Heyndrickxia coagulans]